MLSRYRPVVGEGIYRWPVVSLNKGPVMQKFGVFLLWQPEIAVEKNSQVLVILDDMTPILFNSNETKKRSFFNACDTIMRFCLSMHSENFHHHFDTDILPNTIQTSRLLVTREKVWNKTFSSPLLVHRCYFCNEHSIVVTYLCWFFYDSWVVIGYTAVFQIYKCCGTWNVRQCNGRVWKVGYAW